MSTNARLYILAISVGFLLVVLLLGSYYLFIYRPNKKISQRTSLPPHEVSFKHLLSLPNGESRIEGESIIIDVFLVTPERIGTNTNRWGFDLSDYPGRGYLSNPPRAGIDRCSELIKINCFDFSIGRGGPMGSESFSNLHVVTDANEEFPFHARVRLHGKLIMKNEKFGDHVRLDSIIAVTKIEEPR